MFTHTYIQIRSWLKTHRRKLSASALSLGFAFSVTLNWYASTTQFQAHFLQDRVIEELRTSHATAIDVTVEEKHAAAPSEEPTNESTAIPHQETPTQPVIESNQSKSEAHESSNQSSSESSDMRSEANEQRVAPADDFPAFERTVWPISKVPNWGAMTTSAEWDRSYREIRPEEFVGIPRYDLTVLTTPLATLREPRNVPAITAKLFYSTRFLGRYDLDSGEYEGDHEGIDLKLALGTPIGAVAGGKVVRVTQDSGGLGLSISIEHHIGSKVFLSVYGHLGSAAVKEGDTVRPGQYIGTVGMTGNTSAPHLHLQIDNQNRQTVHPVEFLGRHAGGV